MEGSGSDQINVQLFQVSSARFKVQAGNPRQHSTLTFALHTDLRPLSSNPVELGDSALTKGPLVDSWISHDQRTVQPAHIHHTSAG